MSLSLFLMTLYSIPQLDAVRNTKLQENANAEYCNKTEWKDFAVLKLPVLKWIFESYHSAEGVICHLLLSVWTCIWSARTTAKSPLSYLSLTAVVLSLAALASDFYHLHPGEDRGWLRVDGKTKKKKAWYVSYELQSVNERKIRFSAMKCIFKSPESFRFT